MNEPINDGGPAFPASLYKLEYGQESVVPHEGMTMRDYFAAMAIPIAWKAYGYFDDNAIAKSAYQIADAMLIAREAK